MTKYKFDDLDPDCESLKGRLREWCRGLDDQGNPLPKHKVLEYRKFFASGGMRDVRSQARASYTNKQKAKTEKFHELWARLHSYSPAEWNAAAAEAWLNHWESEIPPFGCTCRRHWKSIRRELPPDFSSRESFYAWTVAIHNLVNRRLGKPQWKPRGSHEPG